MQTHRFDAISFFFGLVFVAMASWALLVDGGFDIDSRWVWPVVLVAGGLALLVSSFRRPAPGELPDASALSATDDGSVPISDDPER